MADKEKTQEERKTGGPKMLRPGIGNKIRKAFSKKKKTFESPMKMERDLFRGGGRAGYKSGSKGWKMATKGKGRAYGKNS